MLREGYIEKIKYKSEETGYVVMEVETPDGDEIFVGNQASVSEGMYIIAEGEYVHHPQYDLQFKFTSCELKLPDDIYGIERYLASGVIKGIGEVLAKRIVKKFKMDTLRIIEEEPERLAEVNGISKEKARKIAISYSETREFQEVLMFLSGYGINVNLAMKIYNEYGDDVYSIVKDNPYKIAEDIPGVGFKTADEIAEKAGVLRDSVFRKRAAALYTLSQSMGLGHIFLPEKMLTAKVCELIGINLMSFYEDDFHEEEIQAEFHDLYIQLAVEGKLVIKNIDLYGEKDVTVIYLAVNYYTELNSARMLKDLMLRYDTPIEEVEESLSFIEKNLGIELEETQKEAVITAISSGVAVITGGPGTGKTTIINAVIEYFQTNGLEIKLAAPTGRAAKRITESTGHKAETIHRLLEFSGVPGDEGNVTLRFGRNSENPLECDAVIIDEASMVDAFLFHSLLNAIAYGTRLILVGDINQLPSVGAGNVLHDVIDSECFPVTELTKIFRQAAESDIVKNAHLIKNGEHLTIGNKNSDFFFIPRRNTDDILKELSVLIMDNLPKYLGVSAYDIQVLTPMRKYDLGVENLNKRLQVVMNQARKGVHEKEKNDVIFREGDKVMQIKNNYRLEWKIYGGKGYIKEEGMGVFNGDMGTVKLINDFDEELTVLFDDGREAVYSYGSLDELEHAFAITIHKSQGSEYPAIIIPLFDGPRKLLSRNLLYTAITRAKRLVVIVGNLNLVNQMINNVEEQKRFTTFALRLREM